MTSIQTMFTIMKSRLGSPSTLVRSCLVAALLILCSHPTYSEESSASLDAKIKKFESMMKEMESHLQELREERTRLEAAKVQQENQVQLLKEEVATLKEAGLAQESTWFNRFTFGGYGEFHANLDEGQGKDLIDFHRFVLYAGYDFNEWIKFHSETEIEHAFVSDGDGELSIEQAYVDFLLHDAINVRMGRILTPVGIINQKHEPPSFYGVERPSFSKSIIPTTWSSDGIGLFGSILPSLKYEAYLVGGLDGSRFNAIDGIRGGRIKERPSLNDLSVTGRLDYYPFVGSEIPYGQALRLGVSAFAGGLDNGNKGKNPGVDGDIQVYSGDFEYTIDRFDLRGVFAFETIDGAKQIGNNVAEEIIGWYLELGYHFWPDAWKTGILERSDAVVFVRYDDLDTQSQVPSGVTADPAGDRTEWTLGVNFYPTSNFVLKADYQLRDDETLDGLDNAINLGMGWQF